MSLFSEKVDRAGTSDFRSERAVTACEKLNLDPYGSAVVGLESII